MAALEQISDDALAPGDVRKRWRLFKPFAALYNALTGNVQIIWNSGRNLWTLSDSNLTLELTPPAVPVAATPRPFQLVNADDEDGTKVRVIISTLSDELPSGFSVGDNPPYILDVSDGDTIYACITFDVSGGYVGEANSWTLGVGSSVPEDDNENAVFYYKIGSVSVIDGTSYPVNYCYGPLVCSPWRDWFNTDVVYNPDWGTS